MGTQVRTYHGRAARDLRRGEVELEIIIPELTPGLQSDFKPQYRDNKIATINIDGTTTYSQTKSSNCITATYKGKSNFKYPPMVRANEQVEVTQYGNTDKYYWDCVGRDADLRQQEVMRLEVSNTTSPSETKTDDNTCFFEINTLDKTITLKTSDNDGEKARYGLVINMGAGTTTYSDNKGNVFHINSNENLLSLSNGNGAVFQLTRDNILISAPGDILIRSGSKIYNHTRSYAVKSRTTGFYGTDFFINVSGNILLKAKSLAISLMESLMIKAKNGYMEIQTKFGFNKGELCVEKPIKGTIGGIEIYKDLDIESVKVDDNLCKDLDKSPSP